VLYCFEISTDDSYSTSCDRTLGQCESKSWMLVNFYRDPADNAPRARGLVPCAPAPEAFVCESSSMLQFAPDEDAARKWEASVVHLPEASGLSCRPASDADRLRLPTP
jgi:hypothetical protein